MTHRRIRTGTEELLRRRRPDMLDRAVREAPIPQFPLPEARPATDGHRGHETQIEHASELRRIRNANVAVFGGGSVGGWAMLFLAPYELNFHVYDMDRVTESNIHAGRTVFGRIHLKQYKVHAMKRVIDSTWPGSNIHPHPYKVDEVPDLELVRLLDHCDVALALIDDPGQLMRLNELAHPRTMTVAAALHRGARSGHVIVTGGALPCLACSLGLHENGEIQTLHAEAGLGCDIACVAHIAATMALDILSSRVGNAPLTRWNPDCNIAYVSNYADDLNPDGPGITYQSATRDPDCPVCGNRK